MKFSWKHICGCTKPWGSRFKQNWAAVMDAKKDSSDSNQPLWNVRHSPNANANDPFSSQSFPSPPQIKSALAAASRGSGGKDARAINRGQFIPSKFGENSSSRGKEM
jgi:hypothetical protein